MRQWEIIQKLYNIIKIPPHLISYCLNFPTFICSYYPLRALLWLSITAKNKASPLGDNGVEWSKTAMALTQNDLQGTVRKQGKRGNISNHSPLLACFFTLSTVNFGRTRSTCSQLPLLGLHCLSGISFIPPCLYRSFFYKTSSLSPSIMLSLFIVATSLFFLSSTFPPHSCLSSCMPLSPGSQHPGPSLTLHQARWQLARSRRVKSVPCFVFSSSVLSSVAFLDKLEKQKI